MGLRGAGASAWAVLDIENHKTIGDQGVDSDDNGEFGGESRWITY